jgi:DNA-binding transcriptional LysR family regulator
MVELGHLAHFYAVARHESFTRAAIALRIQQPSVSRSVKLLEDALGVQLFERHPRRVVLTGAGQRIFDSCVKLFEEADNIERIAEAERGELRGPLRVAAAGAVASRLAPAAIAVLAKRHPDVWPMVFSGAVNTAAERIARGDFELGLYFYAERLPHALERREVATARFHLVVRADRARDRATLESFIGSREVEDDRADRFPTLDLLRKTVPKAKIRISTNDIEAHLRLVEAGLGVSVLPRFVVGAALAKRALRDVLPKEQLVFPLWLVTRKGRVLSRAAQAFVDAAKEAMKDALA